MLKRHSRIELIPSSVESTESFLSSLSTSSLTSDIEDEFDNEEKRIFFEFDETERHTSSSSSSSLLSSNDIIRKEFVESSSHDVVESVITKSSSSSKTLSTTKDWKRKLSKDLSSSERSEAIRCLVTMNPTLVRFPSCLNYLMEDRIEAHKLFGMKTTEHLTTLCWSLSRPELSSGPLVTRKFIDVSDQHHHSSTLKNFLPHFTSTHEKVSSTAFSSSISTSSSINHSGKIRIMQWNVLSQAIGFHCDRFATCSKDDISWSSRKWKIIFEIAQYSPDIVCLQEVDRFYFVHKMLQKVGYDGKFAPKPDSPCYHLPDNTGPDGCAIFYNTNRFVLLRTTTRILRVRGIESNQVALSCTFRCKVSGKTFAVVTTHLKARKGSLLSIVRNEQGKDLLNFVHDECHSTPVIVTGDFNAESTEPVFKTMSSSTLTSAYDEHLSSTRMSTYPSNWTQRVNEAETKQTVDYIFYSKDRMKVTSLLDLHCPHLHNPIPNSQYPSDHLSLVADLSFR